MMINFLLGHKGSYVSARLLASKLGLKYTSDTSKITSPPVVRYGVSSNPTFGDDDTNYNSPEAIRLCANSVMFSKFCEKNGFNSPLYTPFNKVSELVFPFLLRKNQHRAGKDIIFITKEEDLEKVKLRGSFYHVPFMETHLEVGIHVVCGTVVKLFKKKKLSNGNSHPFIRNMNKGYQFYKISNLDENFKVAQNLALKIFECAKVSFGRIDIGYNEKTRRYVIWEINSAPGLNQKTAELYAEKLRGVINVR